MYSFDAVFKQNVWGHCMESKNRKSANRQKDKVSKLPNCPQIQIKLSLQIRGFAICGTYLRTAHLCISNDRTKLSLHTILRIELKRIFMNTNFLHFFHPSAFSLMKNHISPRSGSRSFLF